MTRRFPIALALCGAVTLGGCAQLSQGVSTVCTDIAKLPPAVVLVLDAQDPHSALGVLWADAKAGCAIGAPTVDPSWTAQVWGMLKALGPTVLPWLIGRL